MLKITKPFDCTVDILVVTYQRLELFKKCYESLVANIGDVDYKLYIWDNHSEPEFLRYLNEIQAKNKRVKVTFSKRNVGSCAYRSLAEQSNGEHIVIIDDDVIEFPEDWLAKYLKAYWDAPFPYQVWGMLSTNVVRDETTNGALWPDKKKELIEADQYHEIQSMNGNTFIVGSTYGGWCAMTHRHVYNKTEGFAKKAVSHDGKARIFFAVDGHYGKQVQELGMMTAIYKDLTVYHASGPWHNQKWPKLWERSRKETLEESAKNYLERDPSLTKMNDLICQK